MGSSSCRLIVGCGRKLMTTDAHWIDHFRKRFDLNNIKIIGEASSADPEAADELLGAIKKITEGKGYLPGQVFNADESVLFWGKKKMP